MIEDELDSEKIGGTTTRGNIAFKLRTKIVPFLAKFSDFQSIPQTI